MVILNIVTPIIIVIFNLLLIPHYGAIGAAIATAAGMIVQNFLRQLGLGVGVEISFFEKRYVSFFLVLASSAFGLYLFQLFTPSNIYVALTLAFAISVSCCCW